MCIDGEYPKLTADERSYQSRPNSTSRRMHTLVSQEQHQVSRQRRLCNCGKAGATEEGSNDTRLLFSFISSSLRLVFTQTAYIHSAFKSLPTSPIRHTFAVHSNPYRTRLSRAELVSCLITMSGHPVGSGLAPARTCDRRSKRITTWKANCTR